MQSLKIVESAISLGDKVKQLRQITGRYNAVEGRKFPDKRRVEENERDIKTKVAQKEFGKSVKAQNKMRKWQRDFAGKQRKNEG